MYLNTTPAVYFQAGSGLPVGGAQTSLAQGRSRVVAQWSNDRWHHPAFFQFHYVNVLELKLRCAQHNDVQ